MLSKWFRLRECAENPVSSYHSYEAAQARPLTIVLGYLTRGLRKHLHIN